MGSKRSYDGEEHMQFPYKHQKQFATNEKLNSYADEKLAPIASIVTCNDFNATNIGANALLVIDSFEVNSTHRGQTVVDKGFEDGFRLPWITDCDDDDDSWQKGVHNSLSPEYFDSSLHIRESILLDDPVTSFLDRYPRKQVPVGVNHQAELPELLLNSDQGFTGDQEEKYLGTCVIPKPDSSYPGPDFLHALVGRKDCDCVDSGSVRCVRQHVKEAWEKLFNAVGENKFRELGFVDMGEEVAYRWSQAEEQLFHEVVFSNPASLGKDFWSCLAEEFPTRSMQGIVSYYFNVFMLRKRAAQNRSRFLDIDSDDDEWHPGHGRSYGIGTTSENGDSMVVLDEDLSGEDDDSGEDNSDGDEGPSVSDDKEKTHQPNMETPHKKRNLNPGNHDDSCVSFEFQSGINNSTLETGIAAEEMSGLKNEKYFSSYHSDLSHGCLDYSVNFRHWDQGFSGGLDYLLPTENMIEEIFGPGSWDNKPGHD